MLIHFFLFVFLFLLLFYISGRTTTNFYLLIFLLTKSEKLALWSLAILFLPGTIIHEMSHLLMATILRIPTGHLSVIPKIEKSGEVKTGRLTVGKTDPFRLTLVGLAPMIVGLSLIYLIGKFLLPNSSVILDYKFSILNALGGYLLFSISLTMFSSKKDLNSLILVAPIIFLLITTLYLTGIRISLTYPLIEKITLFLRQLNFSLILANLIDFIALLLLAISLPSGRK